MVCFFGIWACSISSVYPALCFVVGILQKSCPSPKSSPNSYIPQCLNKSTLMLQAHGSSHCFLLGHVFEELNKTKSWIWNSGEKNFLLVNDPKHRFQLKNSGSWFLVSVSFWSWVFLSRSTFGFKSPFLDLVPPSDRLFCKCLSTCSQLL